MSKKNFLTLFVFALFFVLDHLTKYWIVSALPLGDHFSVIPHFFDIVHYRNPGAAFGFLANWDSAGRNLFFYGISFVALVCLVYLWAKTPVSKTGTWLSIALVSSGAVGNLVDRLLRGNVVDFLLIYYKSYVWPAFNVADAAISVGVFGMLILSLKSGNQSK